MKAKIESDVDLDVLSVYSVICFDLDEIRHRDLKSDETVFMTKKKCSRLMTKVLHQLRVTPRCTLVM